MSEADRTDVPNPRWRRPLAIVGISVVALASAFVGTLLAYHLVAVSPAEVGGWFSDFAKSAGMAALIALVAAILAYRGIAKQVAVARTQLEHQQQQSRDLSWWARFEWTSDRAIPANEKDVALPLSVTVNTLEMLAQDATTKVQQAAVDPAKVQ